MIWTTRPRSDFGRLRAIRQGDGPAVLLIHGVGLRAEAWNAQLDTLSSMFRVTAVDMPGHGASALPAGAQDLRSYTDTIASGLDTPAIVIGHSMGAMIALDLAARHKGKVLGVAALNAIFNRSDTAAKAVKARASLLDTETGADPTPTLARWFGDADVIEKEVCRNWLTNVDPMAYRRAYSIFAHENGPDIDTLSALTCPALFLTGSAEPNSTPEMSETMASLTPKGKAQIITGAAHMMPMTHAAEVNSALLEFARKSAHGRD
ncbi:alpha/beta hydrolase [Ruegeria conchae]|uniref:alpha/beta fold hydrolase n=1 Tax=Ruegeria conchae TaxID=981384 RepID=UPI0029C97B42|nr:alpha/beta hydrolase [Ruegeria conchae]